MSRKTPSFTLESLVAWERRYHSSLGISLKGKHGKYGNWWLLWLGKLWWCTRKGTIKFWCSKNVFCLHSCSMCDLNVSAWMWDLRKLKLLCRVEALQDLLSKRLTSWGDIFSYVLRFVYLRKHRTLSNHVKPGFSHQVRNLHFAIEKNAARGVRKDQPAAISVCCLGWVMSQAQQIGMMWYDVIWLCLDFRSCRNFMEFVWSKQFPHQLYSALQCHLKARVDSPQDLLNDITAHVRSGEVAKTCWVMGGAVLNLKYFHFQTGRGHQANVLSMANGMFTIVYIYWLYVDHNSWHCSTICGFIAVSRCEVEQVKSTSHEDFLSPRRCWPSLVVRGLEKRHFWTMP